MPLAADLSAICSRLSLVVLGVGRGADMVYDGVCSSSYVLCFDRAPLLLVGIGPGVTRQCLSLFGEVPRNIFVHSNRTHCCGELPVVVAIEAGKGQHPLKVFSDRHVLRRVEAYRLAELEDVLRHQHRTLSDLCQLMEVAGTSDASQPAAVLLAEPSGEEGKGFQLLLRSFGTVTTERSCGFTLFCRSEGEGTVEWPVLTVVGDSAFDQQLFEAHVSSAPISIVDGRATVSSDHATLSDLRNFAQSCVNRQGAPSALRKLVVGQYGNESDAPLPQTWTSNAEGKSGKPSAQLQLLPAVVGMVIPLDQSAKVRDVKSASAPRHQGPRSPMRDSSPLRNSHRDAHAKSFMDDRRKQLGIAAGATATPGVSRIYVFPFEDKGSPGKLFMASHFRTVEQIRLRASELLGVRPVGNLHLMPGGKVVTSLTELAQDACIVVTRNGGERFSMDALPLLVKKQWGHQLPATYSPRKPSPSRPPLPPQPTGTSPHLPTRQLPVVIAAPQEDETSALSEAYIRSAQGVLSSLNQDRLLLQSNSRSQLARQAQSNLRDVSSSDLLIDRNGSAAAVAADEIDIFGGTLTSSSAVGATLVASNLVVSNNDHRQPPTALAASDDSRGIASELPPLGRPGTEKSNLHATDDEEERKEQNGDPSSSAAAMALSRSSSQLGQKRFASIA